MTDIVNTANRPELRAAYKAAVAYVDKHSHQMTKVQLDAAGELKRRLKRLEADANRLVKINNLLVASEVPQMRFDESTDTMTVSHKGETHSFKLNRADANVPVKLVQSASMGAYDAGAEPPADEPPDAQELKLVMEEMLEQYYANAFRITKLVQLVTGRAKYHVPEITFVRNKLIEHPEQGSLYSFGYGSSGPVVKPIHTGQRDLHDRGLVPNSNALAESLRKVFLDV